LQRSDLPQSGHPVLGHTRAAGTALPQTREAKVALVTGAGGFAGRHLVDALRRTSWSVVGLVRRTPGDSQPGPCPLVVADLLEPAVLRGIMRDISPDYVFHLAAATPPASDETTFAVNIGGTSALLDAIALERPDARVLVVGSDAQYGLLDPGDRPTPETAAMRPLSAYGRSKVIQESIALRYAAMTGLRVVCLRPFNYIGPGQSDRFVVGAIARQIALAEAGLASSTIEVGRLDVCRDFADVRDVVLAFVRAILLGPPGAVYNVGTGTSRSIGELAAMLASSARVPVSLRTVPERVRPVDVEVTRCDASRLRAETGWAPTIPIEQTLADTLDHVRAALAGTTSQFVDR
jgi:GDP-4-dehydro-6-deoxy-D-mannose reductase